MKATVEEVEVVVMKATVEEETVVEEVGKLFLDISIYDNDWYMLIVHHMMTFVRYNRQHLPN